MFWSVTHNLGFSYVLGFSDNWGSVGEQLWPNNTIIMNKIETSMDEKRRWQWRKEREREREGGRVRKRGGRERERGGSKISCCPQLYYPSLNFPFLTLSSNPRNDLGMLKYSWSCQWSLFERGGERRRKRGKRVRGEHAHVRDSKGAKEGEEEQGMWYIVLLIPVTFYHSLL